MNISGILKSNLVHWIEPEKEIDTEKRQRPKWVEKSFDVKTINGNEELFITAHGCYEVYINNHRVGDFVFAPGTSEYEKELYVQRYSVADLLREGKNTIKVLLGDGWYRSAAGVTGARNLFGTHIGLLAWISSKDSIIVKTDGTWETYPHSEIVSADMCQGEVIDCSKTVQENKSHVYEKNYSFNNLIFTDNPHIVEKERFKGKQIKTPSGKTVIDFGQNIAGYVQMTFNAKSGQKIILTHGETLDENGEFTIENFQPGERHKEGGIFQRIEYTAHDGKNTYKPHFSIFGFRYCLIETDILLEDAVFEAIAVYSDMEETASFESSNEKLNTLFKNAMWSMKGNFCDIPTDCPTRERAGWTGDAGIFVNTGLYLMDCRRIYEKWLASCRANQYKSGAVRNIVPRNNEESFFGKLLSASAGWGDAIIIVTHTLYKRYGEQSIIRENYEAMKKWLMFLRKRAKKGCIKKLLSGSLDSFYDVTSGLDYGEWAEPDIEFASGVDMKGKSGVATAYLSYSARLLAEMADIIGKHEDAKEFLKISQGAKKAYQHRFTSNGIIESDRQKDYVRPIAFGLLDEKDICINAKKLNALVEKMDFHLNTGFLSTPFLCKVLADNGYVETAYKLLLQETKPSWLYEVSQGATTVWETWDGKASQNHYSYGAICEWLIEGVCGLKYTFDELVLNPLPSKQLQYAKVSYKSEKGVIKVGWHYEDDKCLYSVKLPDGLSGKLIKPNGEEVIVQGSYICEL